MPNGEHTERIVRAETRLEDLRDDIADLKETVSQHDREQGAKFDTLGDEMHKLEIRLTSIETRLLTWGSLLVGTVVVAGVVVPVALSLIGR